MNHKFVHKKIVDIGLIVEILSQLITRDLLEGKDYNRYINIFKKHFVPNSILLNEYKLYNLLLEVKCKNNLEAFSILKEVTDFCTKYTQDELEKSCQRLLSEISSITPVKEFFHNPVKNYKIYATIQQYLEKSRNKKTIDSISAKKELQGIIVEHLLNNENKLQKIDPDLLTPKKLDNLTYYIIVEQFNYQCKNLLPEQKEVMNKYISAINDKKDLDVFMRNKFNNILETLNSYKCTEEDHKRPCFIKMKMVKDKIKNITESKKIVNNENIYILLRSYDLIKEINKLMKDK